MLPNAQRTVGTSKERSIVPSQASQEQETHLSELRKTPLQTDRVGLPHLSQEETSRQNYRETSVDKKFSFGHSKT